MDDHEDHLGQELRKIRTRTNLKLKEVVGLLEERYGSGALYTSVNALSRIELGKRKRLEKENLLQLLVGAYHLEESEINRLLERFGYGPINHEEKARHKFQADRAGGSGVQSTTSQQHTLSDKSRSLAYEDASSKFVLSIDSIILNAVGELIFGFVREEEIAECGSSYERSLEDFAFALVYGSELRAKWERRDPRLAPNEKPAEPAEFLLWSLPNAPYRVERFSPAFHVDRIFEDQSDRDTLLGYIQCMGICMRQRRFVEWCRNWLKRESAIYLGDNRSLFNAVNDPRDLVYGKTYTRDEILLKKIPSTLGESELATLVSFVPVTPLHGTADRDRYTEQARIRFVLENVLTHITTMYQFEKHVTHGKIWRVPYGLRAELTKEFSKGHHQRQLKHILLSHALDYALHEISLSSDRVDVIHTLCEMRNQRPFNEIRAMLDELSLTLWREDDEADQKAERFIEEIRRARIGDDLVDAFFASHSSVLRELARTDSDGYRERLYEFFPELSLLHAVRQPFDGRTKPIRSFAPQVLAA